MFSSTHAMRPVVEAAPATWGDDEPDPQSFEPVPEERVRAFFPNRTLWRTRGPRQHLRPAVVRLPQRRENVSKPRERRARRASTSSRASPDDPSPPESEPPPVEVWRGVAAASVRMVQHCERRRAKRDCAASVSGLYTYIPLRLRPGAEGREAASVRLAAGCHLSCEAHRDLNTNRGIVAAERLSFSRQLARRFRKVDHGERLTCKLRRLKAAGWINFRRA